ncbi:hypothetical protein DAPPUDRAFT_105505 [Daphnia pulex]|uniref:Peptidase S1 domain-containing protein n=1 Tax=Daphnia pulex TaxID=6669 RepID=E9GQ33_DAPPU|nr:hypothetical protein DAPPUDRAFT_105505 [Daphnia pulex]|eukprot:EFX78243.1 hypothetical protein DAPPUDRAFT_105505 [Daphnia pulex]
MAKPFQSRPAVVFLIAALQFYFDPANSAGSRMHKNKRFVPTLDEITLNGWQAPEQLEESNSSQQTRMVDGDATRKNQFPYMVALMRLRSTRPQVWDIAYCGGSLISSTHILTSANCVLRYRRRQKKDKDQRRPIDEKHPPNQNPREIRYVQSGSIKDQYEGELAIVKGWGDTGVNGTSPGVLHHAVKKIISNSKCRESNIPSTVFDHTLCAYRRGKHFCGKGDAGGPLVIESDNANSQQPEGHNQTCHWIQVAIASWGSA